jgi:hypothetical protein
MSRRRERDSKTRLDPHRVGGDSYPNPTRSLRRSVRYRCMSAIIALPDSRESSPRALPELLPSDAHVTWPTMMPRSLRLAMRVTSAA